MQIEADLEKHPWPEVCLLQRGTASPGPAHHPRLGRWNHKPVPTMGEGGLVTPKAS